MPRGNQWGEAILVKREKERLPPPFASPLAAPTPNSNPGTLPLLFISVLYNTNALELLRRTAEARFSARGR